MANSEDDGPLRKVRRLTTEKPDFGSEMVEVRVGTGDQAKVFQAHKDLLVQHSDFFSAALNGNWKESADRAINLPDDDADIFEHFQSFIYTGKLYTVKDGDRHTLKRGGQGDSEIGRLSDIWVLANKLQSTTLKDAVTDSLIAKGMEPGDTFWPHGMHFAIDKVAAKSAGMRRLLVDIAVFKWNDEIFQNCATDNTSKGFMHDLLMALVKVRKHGRGKTRPWEIDGCRYHEHGDDK